MHDLSTDHKVLMVVGATGAGKSTLINGMVNYILGVQWEDDFHFKLIVEDDAVQTESVTSKVTAYTIHFMHNSRVPYTFTIIDTPGFGDTEGLGRDKEITNQIRKFFTICDGNGIDHLNAVGFVTQASLARLTPTQKYIFDSIFSIFGKDVEGNILSLMLVTFCDGKKPQVIAAVDEAKLPYTSFFKFNNSALYSTEDNDIFDKIFWQMGEESFKKFFNEFGKKESVSLIWTKEVLENIEKLQKILGGIHTQMEACLAKIDVLRQEEMY